MESKQTKKYCKDCASYTKPQCYHPWKIKVYGNGRPIYVARKSSCEYWNTDKAQAGQYG